MNTSPIRLAPRRLGHFNLYVSDLAAATAFYQDVCGVRYIAGEPEIPIRFFTNGSSHHELGLIELRIGDRIGRDGVVQGTAQAGQRPGLNHLGWEMENEAQLVAAYRRGMARKLPMRTFDHTISRSVYIDDPEGNHHEFFADSDVDWRTFLRGDLERITGRWDPEAEAPSTEGHYEKNPVLAPAPGAAVRPLRLDYGVMRVADMEAMRAFFVGEVGLSEVKAPPGRDGIWLKGAACPSVADLVIIPGRTAGQEPLERMVFRLASAADVDAALARLKAAGRAPAAIVEDVHEVGFVLQDPDGLALQFSASKT